MTRRAGWILTIAAGALAAVATLAWSERDRLLAPSPPLALVEEVDDARIGPKAIAAGERLGGGDRVQLANGRMRATLPSGERVELRAPASLELLKLRKDGSELWLHRGELLVDAPRAKRATLIYTREATCAAASARFLVFAGESETRVRVARGAVHVEGLHRTSTDVAAGKRLTLAAGDLAHPPPPSQPEADAPF